MSEIDARQPAPAEKRQPWQPLHYEKISAAEAEAGLGGASFDGASYS